VAERIVLDGLDLTAKAGIKLDATAVAIGFRTEQLARDRNAYARRLLEDRLPRPLHSLIDRPKALRRALRLRRRWQPKMAIVECRNGMDAGRFPVMTAEAARQLANVWVKEAREQGGSAYLDGGLVFTYTDVSGLPAEVYGT